MLLVGRQEGHPACKKTEWWGAGVVVCLECCADLYMSQLMPVPLTVSCFSKIQIGFTFLVPAHPGSPGKRAVKRVCACVCVCVCVCVWPTCAGVLTISRLGAVVASRTRRITRRVWFHNYCQQHMHPVQLIHCYNLTYSQCRHHYITRSQTSFDLLTERLTLSVTDRQLFMSGILLQHNFFCYSSCIQSIMGFFNNMFGVNVILLVHTHTHNRLTAFGLF